MSIKRTIITTILALALVAVVAPAVTSADTISDLMAQITALQAQLNGLQQTSMTQSVGNCTGVTFTRNLMVGSTGSDVKCLQTLLNLSSTTQVAITGAGSPSHETTYFGSLTLSAVRKYQTQHGWTPANQVGPLTRAALNASLGTYVPPVTTLPQGCTSNSGYSPITGQSCATGVVVVTPTGAGLAVMLASDNPASGTIVVGSALTPLVKYVFVNGDNAPVKVTNFKVARTGVSADSDLTNVYLLQGATRLTDSASVASGLVTFNDPTGLFTVPAGSSVEITVASDIYSSATAGETIAIQLASASNIVSNASSIRGNFPINGNLMTTAGTSTTLAGVSFAAAASVTPTTNGSLTPQNAYPVFTDTVTVSTRAVNLTRIAFREIGSVYASDLQNFKLMVDGVQVGSTVQSVDKNGYVTFDLSTSPLVLQATNHTVKLLADIVNGSGRTFYFSIRAAADVNATDSQYGANVLPTIATAAWTTLQASSNGVQTIASGVITVSKATTSPSGNVVLGASNAPIVDYTLTAAGEPIKITNMSFCISDSSNAKFLRNGAVYANGVQIGSTTNISSDGTGTCDSSTTAYSTAFNFGSALIVTPGSPVTLEVRADVHEVSGTAVANGDSVYAELIGTSTYFIAQDTISLGTPTAPSTTAGNTLTVAQGSLALAKYGAYTNQTIVLPQSNYQLGHFTLTGSTTEATNLNTIYVDLSSNTTTVTNMYVKYGAQQTSPISTLTAATSAGSSAPTNTYSINYTLPAGQTIDVYVYGDISSLASGTAISYVRVDGTTSGSAVSVNTGTGGIQGQTITFGSGSFVATQDPQTPISQAVAGGQPVTTGIFKFTAQNDSYTINELKFSLGTSTSAGSQYSAGAITQVALKDVSSGATIATAPVQYLLSVTNGPSQYVAYFTGLSVSVPTGTVKSLAVVETLSSSLSSDTYTTNVDVEPYLSYMKASNSAGTAYCNPKQTGCATATSGLMSTRTVNSTYVYKAVPTVVYAGPTTSTGASTGSQIGLYKATVNALGGNITVKQLKFYVTVNDNSSTHPYLNNFTFFKNGTAVGSSQATIENMTTVTGGCNSGSDLRSTNTIGTNTVVVTFSTEDSVAQNTPATYELKATVNNFKAATTTTSADSVSTYIPYTANYDDTVTTPYLSNGGGARLATDIGRSTLYYIAPGTTGATSPAFIWSDLSGGANNGTTHGYTASTSTDWYNGYLILTAPTTPETVIGQ